MGKSLLPADLTAYIYSTFEQEPAPLRELREETSKMPEADMQVAPDQGHLLSMLVKISGAKRIVEVGVFTGYSSISMALALPEDGKIVACDVSEVFTSKAKQYWAKAGVAKKLDLILGPAVETLDGLLAKGEVFDMAFIDADKPNYCAYLERCIQLLKPGGLIVLDNCMWSGKVSDMQDTSEGTVAIRQVNEMAAKDPRIDSMLVPIGDGMILAIKR